MSDYEIRRKGVVGGSMIQPTDNWDFDKIDWDGFFVAYRNWWSGQYRAALIARGRS